MRSVYIHIPFCNSICSYCDFCKMIHNDSWGSLYLQELKEECEKSGLYFKLSEYGYELGVGGIRMHVVVDEMANYDNNLGLDLAFKAHLIIQSVNELEGKY